MLDGAIVWLLATDMGSPGPNGRFPLWLSALFHGSNLVGGLLLLLIFGVALRKWYVHRGRLEFWPFWKVFGCVPFLGLSRLIRVAEMGGPPYHLVALVDFAAAVHLAFSTRAMWPVVQKAMDLRKSLHAERNRAQEAQARYELMAAELDALTRRKAAEVDRCIELQHWRDAAARLAELKAGAEELKRRGPR